MSTRIQIEQAVIRRLGGATGSIASGDGTSAVLTDMRDFTGDDSRWVGGTIIMPDAATEADQSRAILEWDDSEGKVTWVRERTDVTYTSETFIIVPRGLSLSKRELDTALDDRLAKTRRNVISAVPTLERQFTYPLARFAWIRSEQDVPLVELRRSPNLLDNSNFSVWGNGPALAPTSWALTGDSATVARSTTGATVGRYSAAITRSGTDALLTQALGHLNLQLRGKTVIAGGWLQSSDASSLRIGIGDGIGTSYSSYHAGDGVLTWTTVSHTMSANATAFNVICRADVNGTNYASNVVAQEGSTIETTLKEQGDSGYRREPLEHGRALDAGGETVVELDFSKSRGNQVVLTSRQPFPALAANSTASDCPDAVIIPGLMYELASRFRRGEDSVYWDAVATRAGREYDRAMRHLISAPTPAHRHGVTIRSA